MRVFVDESGTFGWKSPGWSIVAAVGITEGDGAYEAVAIRLRRWERSLPPSWRDGGEIKGRLLSDDDLTEFVVTVLESHRAKMQITLGGFDSSRSTRSELTGYRDRLGTLATPELLRYVAAHNRRMTQTVGELIGWVRGRSEEQVAWLVCLQNTFAHALQHAVVALMDGDDRELADIRLVVDRSWLRNQRHLNLWHALINSALNERSRTYPLELPNHWPPTHAFRRAYDHEGGLDLRALWRRTQFARSHDEPGVRVADVVAHIALRYFRQRKAANAFAALRRLVMGRGETLLHGVEPRVPPTS